jgi:two-component system NtrC family sensor kinase
MKLVPKLTVALVAGTFAVLVPNGYLRVQREVAVLRSDRVRDHALLGRSLGAAVSALWRTGGRAEALAIVEGVNARSGGLHVLWLDGAGGPGGGDTADAGALHGLASGESLTRIAATPVGAERQTYVSVTVAGVPTGMIELTEPLEAEERAVHRIAVDTVGTTLTLAVVSSVLSVILGLWFVGRPIRALSEKARRIGTGDFSAPLNLPQKDELGQLATEMNAMCEHLLDAHERIERETAARIATLDQLRHADRLMTVGKLASGIAHELGTPLNVISARGEMIASGEATMAEASDYGRIIVDASNRMAKIIRQLLAFARRKPPEKVPRDVHRLAGEVLELLRPLAEKKGVQLNLERRCPEPEATATVDGAAIQQAVTNLVVNAIQAMPKGGKIDLAIERQTAQPPHADRPEPCLCVRVRDQGEGIAPEDLPRVFEPFFTTKDVGEGTGLGLSVTHGIVQDHGGWIEVESKAKEGTVFSIYLPTGKPA